MKPIVIEDKGNVAFKLTIAANEVRIKLASNASEQERADVIQFYTAVAARPEIQSCTKTLRGRMYSRADHDDNYFKTRLLILQTENRDQTFRFNRSDFEGV